MIDTPGSRPAEQLLTQMVAAHGMWKYRLHEAIRTGNSSFRVEVVATDDRCSLGAWLYGDEGGRLSGQTRYDNVRQLHTRFHKLAAEILRLALDRQDDQARRMMLPGTEFLTVSSALITELDAWRTGADARPDHGDGLGSDPVVRELIGASLETAAQATVADEAASMVGARLESLAGAVEQLSATIREIASASNAAMTVTAEAGREATDFTAGVARLTDAVGQIEHVLSFITAIARQTNLLALNATIEAARAGDAGRGFAVVATEVKELARQTANAAGDVSRQISDIQVQAADTMAGMRRFTDSIQAAENAQATIATAVEEQTAATGQISRDVNEAATAGRDIADNLAAVALAAHTTVGTIRNLDRTSAGSAVTDAAPTPGLVTV